MIEEAEDRVVAAKLPDLYLEMHELRLLSVEIVETMDSHWYVLARNNFYRGVVYVALFYEFVPCSIGSCRSPRRVGSQELTDVYE
jgi:hypothetical protein